MCARSGRGVASTRDGSARLAGQEHVAFDQVVGGAVGGPPIQASASSADLPIPDGPSTTNSAMWGGPVGGDLGDGVL